MSLWNSLFVSSTIDRLVLVFKWLVLSVIIWLMFFCVYSSLCLYADGSNFLFNILTKEGFYCFDKPRYFAQFVTQFPAVMAIKAGVCDVNLLINIYSFGLVAIPLAFWWMALFVNYKNDYFWFFLLAFSSVYLNSGFFAIGEYNFTYGAVALASAVLVKREPLNLFHCWSLLVLSFLLLRSYEAMFFLGPTLCGLSLLRICIARKSNYAFWGYENLVILVSCLFYIWSAVISVFSILGPRASINAVGLASLGLIFECKQLTVSFCCLGVCSALVVFSRSRLVKIAAVLAVCLLIYFVANRDLWLTPYCYFSVRMFSGFILFCILLLVAVYFLFFEQKNTTVNWCLKLVCICLFFSLVVPFLVHVNGFCRWVEKFEREVDSREGLVAIEDTGLFTLGNNDYSWVWTNPILSLLLQKDGRGAVVMNQEGCVWQPFDPEKGGVAIPKKFSKTSFLY